MEPAEEAAPAVNDTNSGSELDRVYLDLTPVKSFLHSTSEVQVQASLPVVPPPDDVAETLTVDPKPGTTPEEPHTESPGGLEAQQVQAIPSMVPSHFTKPCSHRAMCDFSWQRQPESQESLEPIEPTPRITTVKLQAEQQRISFPANCPDTIASAPVTASPPVKDKLRVTSAGIQPRSRLSTLDVAIQPDPLLSHRGRVHRGEETCPGPPQQCGASIQHGCSKPRVRASVRPSSIPAETSCSLSGP